MQKKSLESRPAVKAGGGRDDAIRTATAGAHIEVRRDAVVSFVSPPSGYSSFSHHEIPRKSLTSLDRDRYPKRSAKFSGAIRGEKVRLKFRSAECRCEYSLFAFKSHVDHRDFIPHA